MKRTALGHIRKTSILRTSQVLAIVVVLLGHFRLSEADWRDLVARDFCKKCIEERQGVGFFEDPDDCRFFLRCDLGPFHEIIFQRYECSPGTLFDRAIPACVHCNNASCVGSKAPEPRCPVTDPPVPMTVPPPPVISIAAGAQCCKARFDTGYTYCEEPRNSHVYYRKANVDGFVQRVSCGHLIFSVNPNRCECVPPDLGPVALYTFEVPRPFDSKVGNFMTDTQGVGLHATTAGSEDGFDEFSGQFDGIGDMEAPLFSGYDWGTSLTVSFFYKTDARDRVLRAILANGNCDIPPTFLFVTQGNDLHCEMDVVDRGAFFRKRIPKLCKYSDIFKQLPEDSWVGVVTTFNSLKIHTRVKIMKTGEIREGNSTLCVGSVPATLAPLNIGRDLYCIKQNGRSLAGNFVGKLDQVQIYRRALESWETDRVLAEEVNIRT
ncbi:uncharacterized protein LOC106163472 isoform X2 [Lingula anatina]|uniref:Uncharacterized protein LOC106163472 isoform X2 n=1 Tax=Lingula anatina TaxID=7574 RepID=A0A1S3IE51_LINAN|nr:uncharacterized protein LOC106163472 isoform X2 [Lingula anatina]|eukprot:XP_013396535.1 uncharacterized protein LOC106163472 isoform X2 [Lingula anatina]